MSLKILYAYNWVPDHQRKGKFSECSTSETVAYIEQVLTSFGASVIRLNLLNPSQMIDALKYYSPLDLAFITAEGFLDEPASMYDGTGTMKLRQILEQAGIPYTHSGVNGMMCCRNKKMTYSHLEQAGVPIPKNCVLFQPITVDSIEMAEREVGYPMFVKPCGGGSSIGIDEKSIVRCRDELVDKLKQLVQIIDDQPVIAETYLSGREYTVGVIGNELPIVMPIIAFPEDVTVRSHAVKNEEHQERGRFEVLNVDRTIGLKIREKSLKVFRSLPVRDLIRIDFKQDEHENIFVIDVNGTPSMSLRGSIAFMAKSAGLKYRDFVGFFLFTVLTRYNVPICNELEETAIRVRAALLGLDNQVA